MICGAVFLGLVEAGGLEAGPLISNVNTDKARHAPGTQLTLWVDFLNNTGEVVTGGVRVVITHLGDVVTNLAPQSLSGLGVGATTTRSFTWTAPVQDYQGYLVTVSAFNAAGTVLDVFPCAIDVSSDWARFPRYGFVANYPAGLDGYHVMWLLKNYHLNGVQFYDWQWKHHQPFNSASSWPDVANRTVYKATVTSLIEAAHSYNMVAMNYNLYGAAYQDYLTDGSGLALGMGIFSSARPSTGYKLADQMSFGLPAGWATAKLYQMNNRNPAWQNFIFGKEREVFSNFGFDGWHIDSLGTHLAYDYGGAQFNLDDYNPQFINAAKTALGKRMLFNTVDAVGEGQVARSANVEFVYSELWGANASFNDLDRRVETVRQAGGKAVVFAAYLNRGLTSGVFNEAGVRLADAAIFAAGAAHLELGDGDKMLHSEYFPASANVLMTGSLQTALRGYYDFLVGYENLLRDGAVSAAQPVAITDLPTSTSGAAGAVWVMPKKTLGYRVLHLVNLLNVTNSSWRDESGTCPLPATLSNLVMKMYYSGALGAGRLLWATPDSNCGNAAVLSRTEGSDALGQFVTFTVPQLQYWDMVWLEMKGTSDALAKLRATNCDSMAGASVEPALDEGGGSDVCGAGSTTGSSWLAFHNLDFSAGCSNLLVRVASAQGGGTLEFRLDSQAGPLIASVAVGATGGGQTWQTLSAPVSGASGLHRLFVLFRAASTSLNWFKFGLGTNSPPFLSVLEDQVVLAGATLVFTNLATDRDAPPQTLTFSLLQGPAGAALEPRTGLFTWRPPLALAGTSQTFWVTVADDGQPPLSATQSVCITVKSPAPPELGLQPSLNGSFSLCVNGPAGPDYVVWGSTNLLDWSELFITNSPALPFTWADPNAAHWPVRFYRIGLGP